MPLIILIGWLYICYLLIRKAPYIIAFPFLVIYAICRVFILPAAQILFEILKVFFVLLKEFLLLLPTYFWEKALFRRRQAARERMEVELKDSYLMLGAMKKTNEVKDCLPMPCGLSSRKKGCS